MRRLVPWLLVGMLLVLTLGVLLLSAGQAPRTNSSSACVADMDQASPVIPMPKPTRLKFATQRIGFSFTPADRQFVPRAPARDAWLQFHEIKQSTASYEIFLARIHPDSPAGANPPFRAQNVWVALAKHVAFPPNSSQEPVASLPPCAFGSSMIVVNASTGRAIVSAGG